MPTVGTVSDVNLGGECMSSLVLLGRFGACAVGSANTHTHMHAHTHTQTTHTDTQFHICTHMYFFFFFSVLFFFLLQWWGSNAENILHHCAPFFVLFNHYRAKPFLEQSSALVCTGAAPSRLICLSVFPVGGLFRRD